MNKDNPHLRNILRYFRFINKCKISNFEKTEVHHILPKCMGGDNSSNNLVAVSYREHFVCHKILAKCFPDNSKVLFSFVAMAMGNKKTNKGRAITSRHFEEVKKIRLTALKLNPNPNLTFKGKNHTKEFKEYVGLKNSQRKEKFGYYHSDLGLERMRIAASISTKARWEIFRIFKGQRPCVVMDLIQTTLVNKRLVNEMPRVSLKLIMIWSYLDGDVKQDNLKDEIRLGNSEP